MIVYLYKPGVNWLFAFAPSLLLGLPLQSHHIKAMQLIVSFYSKGVVIAQVLTSAITDSPP